MKVKFANAEVEVWKLRKGVVLGCGSEYVYLTHFRVLVGYVNITVEFWDGEYHNYPSDKLEWLEPH